MASKTRIRKHGRNRVDPRPSSSKSTSVIGPLSLFLADQFDEHESRLAIVANQFAKIPFDASKFQRELVEKLKRFKYPSPPEKKEGRITFYELLRQARGIRRLLERSTLQEINGCLLIPQIIARDRDLEEGNLSGVGYPLSFHRRLRREAEERLQEIEEHVQEFGETDWMEKYRGRIERQWRDNVTLVRLSEKYTGNRGELMGTHHKERLAARVAMYWLLRTRLHGQKKISDRFLYQLSLVIDSPPDMTELDFDEVEAFRKTIADSASRWRNRLNIPHQK